MNVYYKNCWPSEIGYFRALFKIWISKLRDGFTPSQSQRRRYIANHWLFMYSERKPHSLTFKFKIIIFSRMPYKIFKTDLICNEPWWEGPYWLKLPAKRKLRLYLVAWPGVVIGRAFTVECPNLTSSDQYKPVHWDGNFRNKLFC